MIIGQVSQELGDIVMNMTFDFEGLFFIFYFLSEWCNDCSPLTNRQKKDFPSQYLQFHMLRPSIDGSIEVEVKYPNNRLDYTFTQPQLFYGI